MIITTPLEYEHRLRVFIGMGNNAGLIRGLVKRRIWFAITDRVEEANFVWTQLKNLPYFELQKKKNPQLETKPSDKIMDVGILTEHESSVFKHYFANCSNIEERMD